MVRFGRVKKKTKAEPVAALPTPTPTLRDSRESVVDYTNADSDIFVSSLPVPVPVPDTLPAPVPDVPRVSLPHVDTQLNMHQYNGLFDLSSSPDGQNSSSAIDSTGGLFQCCLNNYSQGSVVVDFLLFSSQIKHSPSPQILPTATHPQPPNGPLRSATQPPGNPAVSSTPCKKTSPASRANAASTAPAPKRHSAQTKPSRHKSRTWASACGTSS